MYRKETIGAISTGMTESGIGIVRISGEDAFSVIDRIFSGKDILSRAESHTIHYGYIKDGDQVIDQVLVSVLRGPRTFTGEDTVEINCHGGTYVVKRVLETVLKNGARPAEPGEFTKRAFLNGKMDLSQAEAVMDLIHAKNEYAMESSLSQLKGSVKKRISDIRRQILHHTAFIETALDDPEHISVEGYGEELNRSVEDMIHQLQDLVDSADDGRIMKEGIQTVILGKPNAGKSSLLNALSGRERAIVTEIEGTTRDALEEQISLQGITLNVVDTAGIRQTEDVVEQMGVEKAQQYASHADLIIFVADASRPLDENDARIAGLISGKKAVILLNKSDLETVLTEEDMRQWMAKQGVTEAADIPILDISAKKEYGIKEFSALLGKMFYGGKISFNDQLYITNQRQKAALAEAKESLEKVKDSIENQMPEDFYSIDLMDAYEALGSITGETIGEDLVNEIFSKFCMGK